MVEMNRIWGPYLKLLKEEKDTAELRYYVQNNRFSPYLELQADSLYENEYNKESFSHLDVNPYFRFFPIFDRLLTPDDLGYQEFNQALSDIILHYLADLDLKFGMCRRDFYIEFLVSDLEQGAFGGISELDYFIGKEKREIAQWLLFLYETGDVSGAVIGAAKALFSSCEIFIRDGEEFVFHMREKWTEEAEKKLSFFIRLFLPVSYEYTVHWIRTYGVTGYEATMQLGGFVLA